MRALNSLVCGSASDWAAATTATNMLDATRKMKEMRKKTEYSTRFDGVIMPNPERRYMYVVLCHALKSPRSLPSETARHDHDCWLIAKSPPSVHPFSCERIMRSQ